MLAINSLGGLPSGNDAESSKPDSIEDDDYVWETDEDSASEKSSMENPHILKVGPSGRDKGPLTSVMTGKQIDNPLPRGTEPNELYLAHMEFLRKSVKSQEKRKKSRLLLPGAIGD